MARWGQAIAEAGRVRLRREELERLQRIVIGDTRFVPIGLRQRGGFVGDHDRRTGEPLPEHLSARAQDLPSLVEGIAAFERLALEGGLDPVVAAATVAFGFVYVHPFEDGNGRLHRWLIHHVLARAEFNPPGVVFPISAVILRKIAPYRQVLESYSRPLLNFIEWKPTGDGNVEVVNDTADYYRYFDATPHAEFLYECVAETIEQDLPNEVKYLEAYDRFVGRVQAFVDMPSHTLDLLWRFLTRTREGSRNAPGPRNSRLSPTRRQSRSKRFLENRGTLLNRQGTKGTNGLGRRRAINPCVAFQTSRSLF